MASSAQRAKNSLFYFMQSTKAVSLKKFCWTSKQVGKKAWRVAINVGKTQYNVRGLLLKSQEDVERLKQASTVFVHLSTEKNKGKK